MIHSSIGGHQHRFANFEVWAKASHVIVEDHVCQASVLPSAGTLVVESSAAGGATAVHAKVQRIAQAERNSIATAKGSLTWRLCIT